MQRGRWRGRRGLQCQLGFPSSGGPTPDLCTHRPPLPHRRSHFIPTVQPPREELYTTQVASSTGRVSPRGKEKSIHLQHRVMQDLMWRRRFHHVGRPAPACSLPALLAATLCFHASGLGSRPLSSWRCSDWSAVPTRGWLAAGQQQSVGANNDTLGGSASSAATRVPSGSLPPCDLVPYDQVVEYERGKKPTAIHIHT